MTDAEKIKMYEDMLGITEDNDRYAALRLCYPTLAPVSVWVLSRLYAAKGRHLTPETLLAAMPVRGGSSPPLDDERTLGAVKVQISKVRRVLGGKETVLNDRHLGYSMPLPVRQQVREKMGLRAITNQTVVSIVAHEPTADIIRRACEAMQQHDNRTPCEKNGHQSYPLNQDWDKCDVCGTKWPAELRKKEATEEAMRVAENADMERRFRLGNRA